jgi:hypothetical protein
LIIRHNDSNHYVGELVMPIISLHTTIVQHQSITPLLRADDVIQTLGLRVFSFDTLGSDSSG